MGFSGGLLLYFLVVQLLVINLEKSKEDILTTLSLKGNTKERITLFLNIVERVGATWFRRPCYFYYYMYLKSTKENKKFFFLMLKKNVLLTLMTTSSGLESNIGGVFLLDKIC